MNEDPEEFVMDVDEATLQEMDECERQADERFLALCERDRRALEGGNDG